MNLHDRDIQRAARREALAEGMAQGLSKGIVQGMEKGIEATENLLRMNVLSVEQIAQATNIPLEQVREMARNIPVETHV
jgi:predicted transposase YdaD